MDFLIDAQLPPRLARQLVGLGHRAAHVGDLSLMSATDQTIWQTAIDRGAILVTKDQDFAIARVARGAGPIVVWIRSGNSDNDTLIARFVGALDAILQSVARGESVVELTSRLP